MRKVLIAIGALIVLGGAVLYALSLPFVMEKNFEWTCGTSTSERCVMRMRAIGHVLSDKGDLDRAATWYRRGADADNAIAMFHLGWALERKAWAQFEKKLPDMYARKNADLSVDFSAPTRPYFEQAAEWYRRAADKGFAPAMNNLGSLYESNMLGSSGPDASFRYYTAAARGGNPIGAFNLARAYFDGRGTARNRVESSKWAEWSPTKFNQDDLSEPTLQRTNFIVGGAAPEKMRRRIKAVADAGPPAIAKLSELH